MTRFQAKLSLAAAAVASGALVLVLGDGQTLVNDQWFYLWRYRGWDPETLLSPHNGHLIVLPLLLYKALFGAFGIESQVPLLVTVALLSAGVASLLYLLVRDAVGEALALGAAVLALFYGAGGDAIVSAFQIPNLIGMSAGLGMLLALRRGDRGGDVAACVLLAASLASFSIGVAFAAAAAAALLLRGRAAALSRAWVVAVPLALFAAWYLWARRFGHQGIDLENARFLGSAVADQLGAALSGLSGLFPVPREELGSGADPVRFSWGPALLVAVIALLYLRLRRPPRPSPDALVAATVLAAYLLMIGLAIHPFRNVTDDRLLYLSSTLTLLALALLFGPYRPRPPARAALAGLFLFSLLANGGQLIRTADFFEERSAVNRAKLSAVDIAGTAAPPELLIEQRGNDMVFTVAEWARIKEEFGSPAYSEEALEAAPAAAREAADQELARALAMQPIAADAVGERGAPAPALLGSFGGRAERRRGCLALLPGPRRPTRFRLGLGTGGAAFESAEPVRVRLGRFADSAAIELPAVAGRVQIPIPPDRSPRPWIAELRIGAPTRVCGVR